MPNTTTLVQTYFDEFGNDFFKRCTVKGKLRSSKHKNELIRAYFGDDKESAKRNLMRLLAALTDENIENDVELEYSESNIDASQSYPSIKIRFINDVERGSLNARAGQWMYAVLNNKIVGKKMLTPDKLGVSGTYYTVDEIKKQISKSLDDEILLQICLNLIDDVIQSESGKHYDTLDELMRSNETYVRKLRNLDIDNESKTSLFNDFGEILGPCFLLSKLNKKGEEPIHSVTFPKTSNTVMYDYILDNCLFISSKHGIGGAPSSVTMANNVLVITNGENPTINKDADKQNEYITEIIPRLANNKKNKDIKNDSYVIRQTLSLFDFLKDKDNTLSNVYDVLKEYNILYSKNFLFDIEHIDTLKKDGKLKEFLKKLYSALNYDASTTYSIKNIIKYWDSNKGLREGCVVYPICSTIVNVINELYSEDITFWGQRALEGYQLYINDTDGKVSIQLKAFEKSEYKLQATASVGNPRNKAISCSIKR